ncbi:hypothetical protein C2E23DRAFT_272217 [Lenzites betulinus]|nr:hypothetical protein C2E23DRAFT_272217 [Lenzites betulinus]
MRLDAARCRNATPGAYPAALVARACARNAARCLGLRVPVLLCPELRRASLGVPVEKQQTKTCPVRECSPSRCAPHNRRHYPSNTIASCNRNPLMRRAAGRRTHISDTPSSVAAACLNDTVTGTLSSYHTPGKRRLPRNCNVARRGRRPPRTAVACAHGRSADSIPVHWRTIPLLDVGGHRLLCSRSPASCTLIRPRLRYVHGVGSSRAAASATRSHGPHTYSCGARQCGRPRRPCVRAAMQCRPSFGRCVALC